MEWLEQGRGPIGELDVRRFEGQVGHRLPADYREFLLAHNGGQPKCNTFMRTVDGAQEPWSLHFGFPIDGSVDDTPLPWVWDVTKDTRPRGVIPVATDEFGNFFYVGFHGSTVSGVYFGATPSPGRRVSLEKVADSFSEFLQGLS